jgi:hypothetical protein
MRDRHFTVVYLSAISVAALGSYHAEVSLWAR